ncbi:beta-1,3-galactosyltransferase 5 [Aplysia californica]|uniref:Hexosyltransferase n=1 Tax=Aplysia californica TaxID=6500 RepID=A0ABM0JV10_APLCA|nr:beta-1,3-galactosyltransferase 5 [Aplysia californica]
MKRLRPSLAGWHSEKSYEFLTHPVSSAILLAATLMALVLVLRKASTVPVMVLQLDSTPHGYVQQLQALVEKQRQELLYQAKHPRVVFRCLDDEPKIWYPKRASDNLTKTLIATDDKCDGDGRLDAVVIVHTAAGNFRRRSQFRKAYSDYKATEPYRLKVVFLIGHVRKADLQIKLEQENRRYGDTLIGEFLDTYQNLTLKAVMGYRWVAEKCKDFPLLIKMDDDVLLDVQKFFDTFWTTREPSRKINTIFCNFWLGATVDRTGKWKVERGLFRNESYSFPYCSGFFVLVTPDLVRPMYEAAKRLDFFWIDDVFLYGMVPAAIKNVRFAQLGGKKTKLITTDARSVKKRLQKEGLSSETWAFLTLNEKEFDENYAFLQRLKTEKLLNETMARNTSIQTK